jgi:hypothetical protein
LLLLYLYYIVAILINKTVGIIEKIIWVIEIFFLKNIKVFFVNLLQNDFVLGTICSLLIFKSLNIFQTITHTKDEDGTTPSDDDIGKLLDARKDNTLRWLCWYKTVNDMKIPYLQSGLIFKQHTHSSL